MQNHVRTILRGVGQVMLQNSAPAGLLFLVGIFYNSWLMGIGSLAGNIVGTFSAALLGYSKEDRENGLYGFNGTLVGAAVFLFFEPSTVTIIALLLGAVLSTVIMRFISDRIPAFTTPFVLSTWLVISTIAFFNLAPLVTSSPVTDSSFNPLSAVSMGLGQVMLQGNIITGVLCFIAILVHSRIAAIYALYGSLLGGLLAFLLSLPPSMINLGLFGYNAVLCSIALGDRRWSSFMLSTLAIGLSVLINLGMGMAGIIPFTAPFVLATWMMLFVKKYAVRT
jgi:urea transporter